MPSVLATAACNPEFTSCVRVACAWAACRMALRGECGARTVFDIPIGMLSARTAGELRHDCL